MEKELESHRLATTDITNVIDKCSAHVRRSVTDMKHTKVYQLMASSSRTCCSRQFPSSRIPGVRCGDCTAVNLSLLSHMVLSTLLILAVCRTRVTTNSVNMALHESPSSSVVRAPDRCYVRSWVRFPSGSQIFSLYHARDKLNIPSLSRIKMFINSVNQNLIYATSVAKANLLNHSVVVWGENSD